ncbi:MAG: hypothetical protein R6W76_05300 [Caldilinea sp.]
MNQTRVQRVAITLAAICLLGVIGLLGMGGGTQVAAQSATATPEPAESSEAESTVGGALVTINPAASLPLDPFLVTVQGGGPIPASTLSRACHGYISSNPTTAITYQGEDELLRFFFFSDSDTTLVVQTPDGAYLCNDDTSPLLLDPTVAILNPAQGVYTVWVGKIDERGLTPGFLAITTREGVTAGSLALRDLVKREPLPAVLPLRERLASAAERIKIVLAGAIPADALAAGDTPIVREITADGELPAPELNTGDVLCAGMVSLIPTYAFDWSGETAQLRLFVEADQDTTLLVRTPDAAFLCADDADGGSNLNPLVTIAEPAEGRYLVWVGRVNLDTPVAGQLTITETADAQPAALPQQ